MAGRRCSGREPLSPHANRMKTIVPPPQPANDSAHAIRAMDGLRRLVRALRAASAAAERAHGVSTAQLFALRQIALGPGQSLRDLAARTLTAQSSVSEVVARLCEHGLVARRTSSRDRRSVELHVTDDGWTVLRQSPDTIQERLISAFDTLSPEQQAVLASGLEAWLAASGLHGVPATMFFEPLPERVPARPPRGGGSAP